MKIKFLVLLLILSLLCGCGAAEVGESTSADQAGSAEISDEMTDTPESTPDNKESEEASISQSEENSESESAEQASQGESAEQNTQTASSEQVLQTEPTEQTSQTASSEQTSQTEPTEQTSQAQEPSEETIIYEKYLAALSMYALVLEYPDFRLDTVYAASFVPMEKKMQSKGIYLSFESGGEKLFAHLYPLESAQADSRTVHCPEVGYAAFDIVSEIPANLSTIAQSDYVALMENISMPSVHS